LMEQVKDSIAQIASQVYAAQADDGRIDWREGLMLSTLAVTAVLPIISAFRGMSTAGVKELIDTLANSRMVLEDNSIPF